MKRVLICFSLVLACLAASVATASNTAPENRPKAVAPDSIYQFQPVLEGEDIVHDFIVRNTGTAELVIENVKTG